MHIAGCSRGDYGGEGAGPRNAAAPAHEEPDSQGFLPPPLSVDVSVGVAVGVADGAGVGLPVPFVGLGEVAVVGESVGVGLPVGLSVGLSVGFPVGLSVGLPVGLSVGFAGVGFWVALGAAVDGPMSAAHHEATWVGPPAASASAVKAALSRDFPWSDRSVAWKALHRPA